MKSILPTEACDVAYAQSLIGGKWKLVILWKLLDRPLRLSELRRAISSISEAVLITQLKELERDGLVNRIDFKTVPPHVEYEPTPQARQLQAILEGIEAWGGMQRTINMGMTSRS